MGSTDTLLLGPASLDRYLQQGLVLPGGGALNMAYHWAHAGFPFHFISRIGDDHPEVFLEFFRRHGIEHSPSIVAAGASASIDIVMGDDRQPWMDNFVEGVWADFRLTPDEEATLGGARRLHAVLVEPVAREVHRLGDAGALAHLTLSGDFLSFRHYTVERFAQTMELLDIGFVGWPGSPDDSTVRGIGAVAIELRRLAVVTLGSRGVLVFDGRAGAERSVPVDAVEVVGTTVGCGDAFIAAFLASLWTDADVATAVEVAKAAGAAATTWLRPLPDEAYAISS